MQRKEMGEQNREVNMPATQDERGDLEDSNNKDITTKAIYTTRIIDLLVPLKVEVKFPQV
jgi:hypothetical protein